MLGIQIHIIVYLLFIIQIKGLTSLHNNFKSFLIPFSLNNK